MDQKRILSWLGLLAVLSAAVGAVAGVFWSRLVHLPAYSIQADGSAVVTGKGLSEFVAADAWFAAIGVITGAAVGVVAWLWFKRLGWPVAFVACGAGILAGVAALFIGQLLGPGSLDVRIATAQPGDLVPVDLKLTSWPAMVTWPFGAVAPALFASALGPEVFRSDEERPRRRRRVEGPDSEEAAASASATLG